MKADANKVIEKKKYMAKEKIFPIYKSALVASLLDTCIHEIHSPYEVGYGADIHSSSPAFFFVGATDSEGQGN
jgi:hypothetical protein